MIIVKLMGGLGNQMFQYATGRRLALQHNAELKLDMSFLNGSVADTTPRKFVLDHFNIIAEMATNYDIDGMRKYNSIFEIYFDKYFGSKFKSNSQIKLYQEKHYFFDRAVMQLPDNSCLEGYWQSQRYFEDIEEVIREEFTIIHPLAGKNKELAEIIKDQNSVSIHIRRGDYISSPKTSAYHGSCSLDYYRTAVDKISLKQSNCQFFIFSDDMDWVKNHFSVSYPMVYVENNDTESAYEDLRLISLCKHHIIANSSFSWWGAWLSLYPDKTVIAPKQWFSDRSINTKDLIPSGWIRI